MARALLSLVALAAALNLAACSKGSGGSPAPPPAPSPSDPCGSAIVEAQGERDESASSTARLEKTAVPDGSTQWRVLDALWTHRQAAVSGRGPQAQAQITGRSAQDVGDLAVVRDEGDLVLPPNSFDLRNTGVRFTPSGGGYEVRQISGQFRTTLGARITLEDDDSRQVDVPFSFPFYGRRQSVAFVNSDGNITFDEQDSASTERNVARLLTGPPRVAPFLADLDPTTGGRVFVHGAADQYTVTWCNVREFDSQRVATMQATLLPDGTVEFKYANPTNLQDGVVGISPGRTGDFKPLNLSDAGPGAGGSGGIGERFANRLQLDTVALVRKFYTTHPDNYDQLVIWTDQLLTLDAFAYEVTVANEIRGIGLDVFDISRDFGSGGRLRSLAVMDFIGKYPEDPNLKFLGENTTMSVLGQEVGHRWLAFMRFRDHKGERSDALLGRGLSHWSFFFNSNASFMEGNEIEDLGGGSFRTTAVVERYGRLDQYAMGLLREDEVGTMFYVENPTNPMPFKRPSSGPQAGVTFTGTRRDFLVQDIIAVHGRRIPDAREAPKLHRQAFIFVVRSGNEPDGAQIARIEQIRRLWEPYFLQSTGGRMRADTRLR